MCPASGGDRQRGAAVERTRQAFAECDGVARRDDELVPESRDRFGQSADVAHHHRGAAGQRLEHHEPEPLERHRRHHAHVGGAVERTEVVVGHRAEEADVAQTEPTCAFDQVRSLGTVARDHEHGVVVEGRPRVEQRVDPGTGHQPADREATRGVGVEVELASGHRRDEPGGTVRGRRRVG